LDIRTIPKCFDLIQINGSYFIDGLPPLITKKGSKRTIALLRFCPRGCDGWRRKGRNL